MNTSKAAVRFQYCTQLFSLEKKIHAAVKAHKDYRQNVVWIPPGGIFCLAENCPPGKGQQTGKYGTVFPKPKAEAHSELSGWDN